MTLRVFLASLAWLWAAPLSAVSLELALPVACTVNETCFIQNYPDRDPDRGGYQDYQCGSLTYDGHTGTDFRVRTTREMQTGIAVLAAAAGRVKGIRDNMEDGHPDKTGRHKLKKREAGNGVVIDHGDGWETQYSHLLKGSVTVFPGKKVKAGEPIGQIGQSGLAEFPHVEFLVRHHGKPVDPFTGETDVAGCGAPRDPLWNAKALTTLSYLPTGELSSGFATRIPTPETYDDPPNLAASLLPEAPALIFWVNLFGVREGDQERIRLIDPMGKVLVKSESEIPRHRAAQQRYVGKKRTGTAPWPGGIYTGEYTLTRLGEDDPLITLRQTLKIPEW